MNLPASPLRLALHNDFEVVARGLMSMLAPYDERVEVVELDTRVPVVRAVDLTLFDTFGRIDIDGAKVQAVLDSKQSGTVVVYSWDMHEDLVDRALSNGCRGYLNKGMNGAELVDALERIHGGEVVVSPMPDHDEATEVPIDDSKGAWPGRSAGLSAREAEVLSLITQGLTNNDIASRSYLSINSVKSYVRSAYRKIGVERRSQAVRWGMENGMLPYPSRVLIT